MRILIINRFFWPDESSTAMLAADLAEDLAAAGHHVEVSCARLLYDKQDSTLRAQESWRSVSIHRLPSTRFGRSNLLGRFSDLISFHAALLFIAPLRFRPDVILVMTDPAMVLLDAMWIAKLRGSAVVHHVMDLYPDIASVLGTLKRGSIVERLLQRLMSVLLRRCEHIIALGDTMKERIVAKGVNPSSISVIPPWGAPEGVAPDRIANSFRAQLGLTPEDFLVMYSGNMGRAHPFEAVLGAIELLRDETRIHFVFVGGGARVTEIQTAINLRQLARVHVLPYQPREKLAETLSAADIHLITQDPATTGLIVPSKLAGILAVGRPALLVGDADSDVGRVLRANDCGTTYAVNEADKLAAGLRVLSNDASRREIMEKNAQVAYLSQFERATCTSRIRAIFEKVTCEETPNT